MLLERQLGSLSGKNTRPPPNQPITFRRPVLWEDRLGGRGGGLITLVHHSITYQEVRPAPFFQNDNTTEIQAIIVEMGGAKLLVCNIYIPPVSSCPQDYRPDFYPVFGYTGDILIMGDFNAHDETWFSSTLDEGARN